MTIFLLILVIISAALLAALLVWRWCDKRRDDAAWHQLTARQPGNPAVFDASMVDGLPDPARRYFLYSIRSGARLCTVCRITMHGEFALGTKRSPNYLPMQAEQVLASPHGFIWKLKAGRGLLRIAGSDAEVLGRSWSRFWLAGLIPVARAGGSPDHALAAFGRHVAESVFWTPAALLTRPGVSWEAVNDTTARATVAHEGLTQSVEVTVNAAGQPIKVRFLRWSDANPEKSFRFQPFGGYLSEFKEFHGFNLPTQVEAGNFFETDDYFPFFLAKVDGIRFP